MQKVKRLQEELDGLKQDRKSTAKHREEIELLKEQIRTMKIDAEAKTKKAE